MDTKNALWSIKTAVQTAVQPAAEINPKTTVSIDAPGGTPVGNKN